MRKYRSKKKALDCHSVFIWVRVRVGVRVERQVSLKLIFFNKNAIFATMRSELEKIDKTRKNTGGDFSIRRLV